jgi:hypothetical protein
MSCIRTTGTYSRDERPERCAHWKQKQGALKALFGHSSKKREGHGALGGTHRGGHFPFGIWWHSPSPVV